MTLDAPRPDDPPALLYEKAQAFWARSEERAAIIARIKAYIAPWMTDKRMRIMGDILLREIARVEKEEAERARP